MPLARFGPSLTPRRPDPLTAIGHGVLLAVLPPDRASASGTPDRARAVRLDSFRETPVRQSEPINDTTRRTHTQLKTNTQRHPQTGILVTAVLSSSGALRASAFHQVKRSNTMLYTVAKIEKNSCSATGCRTLAHTRRQSLLFVYCSPVAPAPPATVSAPSHRPDRHLPKYQLTDSKETIGFVRSLFNAPQTT